MTLIDHLVDADRVVLAGLRAYDEAIEGLRASLLVEARAKMAQHGHTDDEIETFETNHLSRVKQNRQKLHRELWRRVLTRMAEFSEEVEPA